MKRKIDKPQQSKKTKQNSSAEKKNFFLIPFVSSFSSGFGEFD
jgi:hypothetical protein